MTMLRPELIAVANHFITSIILIYNRGVVDTKINLYGEYK